jgi:hypothetical protein
MLQIVERGVESNLQPSNADFGVRKFTSLDFFEPKPYICSCFA